MCFSSKSGVEILCVFLYFVSKLVDNSEGGFATDGSEVTSLEEDDLVNNRACYYG